MPFYLTPVAYFQKNNLEHNKPKNQWGQKNQWGGAAEQGRLFQRVKVKMARLPRFICKN